MRRAIAGLVVVYLTRLMRSAKQGVGFGCRPEVLPASRTTRSGSSFSQSVYRRLAVDEMIVIDPELLFETDHFREHVSNSQSQLGLHRSISACAISTMENTTVPMQLKSAQFDQGAIRCTLAL